MLYREIIALCSQIHTKHINTLCGQEAEFVNVKPGGTYNNQWALKGLLLTHNRIYSPYCPHQQNPVQPRPGISNINQNTNYFTGDPLYLTALKSAVSYRDVWLVGFTLS
jgi:hypothetical protein